MGSLSANSLVYVAQLVSYSRPDLYHFTRLRSTVSFLLKTRPLSLCAESAFTGNSDHSQVKIARLVFIETEMLLSGAEVSADAGYKFQSDW